MEIKKIKAEKLIAYENNARTHSKEQIQQIAASIKEFGFNNPILVDDDNTIIAGHGRLLAAKALGIDEVPIVTLPHLTHSQKKAYILADNRIALNAGWDIEKLQTEFNALLNDDFNIELTGFTNDEIQTYLGTDLDATGLCDADDAVPLENVPISKPGDVWVLGGHRLMCGDSTDPNNVDVLLQESCPLLMVTDPPYGVDYEPEWREGADLGIGKRSKGKVKNDDRADWKDAYSLFTGNVAYIWHASLYSPDVGQHLKDCGFDLISQIIWNKQHFVFSRGDYHWKHEPCWYAVKKGKKHNWQGARDQSTVWEIKNNNSFGNQNKEETFGHGTQKPVDCMLRPILNNSEKFQFVYDPFGGSGTTLIACEKSGRLCLMMEIDPLYCDMIIKRWQKFTGKDAILEQTGKTFNEVADDEEEQSRTRTP